MNHRLCLFAGWFSICWWRRLRCGDLWLGWEQVKYFWRKFFIDQSGKSVYFLYIYSNKREISYGFAFFVICLPTRHSEFLRTCLKVSVCFRLNWNVEVLFFVERENWNTQRKTFRSKGGNQQLTQLTCNADAWTRTSVAMLGGKCPHQCASAILAPQLVLDMFLKKL